MITSVAHDKDGKAILLIGLSFNNLDEFRKHPLDTFIRIDATKLGLPLDVMLVSGQTEAALAGMIQDMIGPDTKVTTDPKLKN